MSKLLYSCPPLGMLKMLMDTRSAFQFLNDARSNRLLWVEKHNCQQVVCTQIPDHCRFESFHLFYVPSSINNALQVGRQVGRQQKEVRIVIVSLSKQNCRYMLYYFLLLCMDGNQIPDHRWFESLHLFYIPTPVIGTLQVAKGGMDCYCPTD